jgi:hypothetical protein
LFDSPISIAASSMIIEKKVMVVDVILLPKIFELRGGAESQKTQIAAFVDKSDGVMPVNVRSIASACSESGADRNSDRVPTNYHQIRPGEVFRNARRRSRW